MSPVLSWPLGLQLISYRSRQRGEKGQKAWEVLWRKWPNFVGRRLLIHDFCQPTRRSEEEYAEEQHVQRLWAEARVASGDREGKQGWWGGLQVEGDSEAEGQGTHVIWVKF